MSHETEIIADEWVAARDEIRRLRSQCTAEKEAADCAMQEAIRLRTVNAALLEALEPFVMHAGKPPYASPHIERARIVIALAKGEKP